MFDKLCWYETVCESVLVGVAAESVAVLLIVSEDVRDLVRD